MPSPRYRLVIGLWITRAPLRCDQRFSSSVIWIAWIATVRSSSASERSSSWIGVAPKRSSVCVAFVVGLGDVHVHHHAAIARELRGGANHLLRGGVQRMRRDADVGLRIALHQLDAFVRPRRRCVSRNAARRVIRHPSRCAQTPGGCRYRARRGSRPRRARCPRR